MKSFSVFIFSLIVLVTLSGCGTITMSNYVGPPLHNFSYQDLDVSQKGPSLGVIFEYQKKGKQVETSPSGTLETILRVLNKSNMFSSVNRGVANTEAQLKLVINNSESGSRIPSYRGGPGGGPTGQLLWDNLIITPSFQHSDSQAFTKEYKHAIYATWGEAVPPEGSKLIGTSEDVEGVNKKGLSSFNVMLEEVILLFLYDLQQAGKL